MEIEEIVKKLHILEKKTSDLLIGASKNAEMASYIKNTKELIKAAQEELSAIDVGEDGYDESFPAIGYQILSTSPFTTKSHLCIVFRCGLSQIDKWAADYPEFAKSIEQGILEGEILARDLLVQSAFEPSANVNTNLLKILSTNVYNINETHDVNLKTPEPLKYQIEVVSANKTKDT